MKLISQEKRAPIVSKNPHPILISLPKEKSENRMEDMQVLIEQNCTKKEKLSLLTLHKMFRV